MSVELVAILVTSLLELCGLVILGVFLSRQLREISRIQRALAGLIVQESEKIQALLRSL
ncbi:MAG: hypothetical protein ACK4Z6_02065 [Candidatus Methylomirabilales bacterium]